MTDSYGFIGVWPARRSAPPPLPLILALASPAPAPVKGEFDDQCAMGLASGQTVKTDCSVNWTDEDGHVYCFSSDASKEAFLKDPAGNIKKAKEFLASKQAAAAAGAKEFTEEDVNKRVAEVVAERSKDGAFVFHDPKLDADLNLDLRADQGRARHGRLWLVRQCHLPRQGHAEEAIRHRFLVQARGRQAHPDGYQGAEGPEAGRRQLLHGDAHAGRLVVAAGAGASRRHGGTARLARDERDPQLHRRRTRTRMAISSSRTTRPARPSRSNSSRCISRSGT